MNTFIRQHCAALLALTVIFVAPATVSAQHDPNRPPDPVYDNQGHTEHKIVHRLAPEINMRSPFSNQAPPLMNKAPAAGNTIASSSLITYHGGPIMPSVSKVVLIWYGSWNQNNGTDTPTGQSIIRDAIYGLSTNNATNNYSGITTGYSSQLGKYIQSDGSYAGQASSAIIEEYVQPASSTYGGNLLTDSNVFKLVTAAAKIKGADLNAIYFVLSSSDIGESSGFLTKYCGWHSYGTINTVPVKFGFIGNPSRKLSACAVQSISPNGNPGVDAMISVLAHELVETVTDPLLNAWYNGSLSENSDMCAWTFGSRLNTTSSGAYWNVNLPAAIGSGGGSRNYLLQRQLAASDSKCYINATGAVQ